MKPLNGMARIIGSTIIVMGKSHITFVLYESAG
jgi:hypothetical protein